MYEIGHYSVDGATLDRFVEQFVPGRSVYYFDDEEILGSLLGEGITVYTPTELLRSFPTFSLDYGSIYHIWDLDLPDTVFVGRLNADELSTLKPALQRKLMEYQVQYGRGHVYHKDWFTDFEPRAGTGNIIREDATWYYLLTFEDWRQYSAEVRRKWVLKWLKSWHKDTRFETVPEDHSGCERVPYHLMMEYAGTFSAQSGPNCFAAAIAMVVDSEQSHTLISQWLHQEPFIRLLQAQGYVEITALRDLDFSLVEPADVLVWVTEDQMVGHAAYAVTGDLVFQKHGQGWESPWQILRTIDVWYNEYLNSGGSVSIYRRT